MPHLSENPSQTPTHSRAPWAELALLFLAALAVRAALLTLVLGLDTPLDGDEHDYHGIAASFAAGDGWKEPGDPAKYRLPEHERLREQGIQPPDAHRSARPPLVPAMLAGVYRIFGPDPRLGRLLWIVLGSLLPPLAWWVTRSLYGTWASRAARTVGWLWVLHPTAVYDSTQLMTETPAALLVLAFTLAAVHSVRRPGARSVAAVGGLAGLLVLDRSNFLLLLPWLLIVGTLSGSAEVRSWARRWGWLALACTAAVLTPWTLRNAAVHHALMLTTSDLGTVLAASNADLDHPRVRAGGYVHEPRFRGFIESHPEADWTRVGLHIVRDQLRGRLQRLPPIVLRRAANFWTWRADPYESLRTSASDSAPSRKSRLKQLRNVVTACVWLPVLVAFVASLGRFSWRDDWPLVAIILYAFLTCLPFWGTPRFRFPVEALVFIRAARWLVPSGAQALAVREHRPQAA